MIRHNSHLSIDPEKYEVFVVQCTANIPFVFAIHPWFVCNEKGKVSRWEVLFRKNEDMGGGHLHKDRYPPFKGIEAFPFSKGWHWKSKVLSRIEGEQAKSMIDFIKKSKENYPHIHRYALCGTNSNTYAQWVLNHFSDINLRLPWNAIGKNAK